MLEHRAGNLERARELFQQGVWAQPKGRDVCTVWQVLRPLAKQLHAAADAACCCCCALKSHAGQLGVLAMRMRQTEPRVRVAGTCEGVCAPCN